MRGMFGLITFSAVGFIASAAMATTYNSNGTGGGSWTSTSTWDSKGIPLNSSLTVKAGDTVTATNVTLDGAAQHPVVYGTLNINSSTFTNIGRFNYTGTSGGGIVNINNSTVVAAYFWSGSSSITANINNGSVVTANTSSSTMVNVNTGGTFNNASGSAGTISILGGTLINTAGSATTSLIAAWNGGTDVINTTSQSYSTSDPLNNLWSSNANNVLDLSSKTSKQTYTTNNSTFTAKGGILRMHVYSSAANDSDLMTYVTSGTYKIPSAVTLQFADQGPLPGTIADYLGKSYKLFNVSGSYSTITPVLAATQWNIGGAEYNVTFANTLSTNGTLTVSTLTAAPEPAVLSLLGVGGIMALRRRRPSM